MKRDSLQKLLRVHGFLATRKEIALQDNNESWAKVIGDYIKCVEDVITMESNTDKISNIYEVDFEHKNKNMSMGFTCTVEATDEASAVKIAKAQNELDVNNEFEVSAVRYVSEV